MSRLQTVYERRLIFETLLGGKGITLTKRLTGSIGKPRRSLFRFYGAPLPGSLTVCSILVFIKGIPIGEIMRRYTGNDFGKMSRYFRMSPDRTEAIKRKQKERYRANPWEQKRRMYLRACEKGLIRCPRKRDEYMWYDEIRNKNMGSVINGEAEEEGT